MNRQPRSDVVPHYPASIRDLATAIQANTHLTSMLSDIEAIPPDAVTARIATGPERGGSIEVLWADDLLTVTLFDRDDEPIETLTGDPGDLEALLLELLR